MPSDTRWSGHRRPFASKGPHAKLSLFAKLIGLRPARGGGGQSFTSTAPALETEYRTVSGTERQTTQEEGREGDGRRRGER